MLRLCVTAAMISLSCTSKISGCIQTNISCTDVQTADGFMFMFHPPLADISEIYVYDNKTLIAYAEPSKQKVKHLSKVLSMNTDSVVTRDCRDLRVHYLLRQGPYVDDSWENYTVMVNMEPPDLRSHSIGIVIGVTAVLCAVVFIAVALCYNFCSTAHDRTTQNQIPLQDCNSIHVGIQPSQNGNSSVSDINGTSNHRAMDRNETDDPGGVNNNSKQLTAWSSEGQEDQAHVNYGQPLLLNEGATAQGFDVTGMAVPLVSKGGRDPDQVSNGSILPDTDVKSQHEEP